MVPRQAGPRLRYSAHGLRSEQLPHRQALSALHAGDGRQLAAQLCRAWYYHGRARGGLRLPAPAARHGLHAAARREKEALCKPRGRRAWHGGHAAAARVLAVLSLGGTPERGRAGPRVAVHLHRAGDRQNGLAGRYHPGRRRDLGGGRRRAGRGGGAVGPSALSRGRTPPGASCWAGCSTVWGAAGPCSSWAAFSCSPALCSSVR